MRIENGELELRLRDRLAVSDDRLNALAMAVEARVGSGDAVGLSGRLSPWRVIAAAALLGVVSFVLQRSNPPRSEGSPRASVSGDDAEGWTVRLTRSGEVRAPSFYEPPGMSQVAAESDVAVYGQVRAVDDGTVEFSVEEVLFGGALLGRAGELDVVERPRGWSCTDVLHWTAHERCVLFLMRDPDSRGLIVTYDGSGKLALPVDVLFDLDDVRAVLRDEALPIAAVVEAMRRRGPRALNTAGYHLALFRGGSSLERAPAIQEELRRYLHGLDDAEPVDWDDLFVVLRHADPAQFSDLPAAAKQRLHREYAAIRESRPNGLFNAFTVLEPLCRAGDRWAADRMLKHLEAVSRPGAEKVHWRYQMAGIAALSAVDPERARGWFWSVYRRMPARDRNDRRDALQAALSFDRARAEEELVALLDERLAAGWGLPIRELIECRSGVAQSRLHALFDDPGLSPRADGLWVRDLRDAARDGDRTEVDRLIPGWIRAEVERRLGRPEQPVSAFLGWLELFECWGDALPKDAAVAAAGRLRGPDLSASERRDLVLALLPWAEVGPSWKSPTDAEVGRLSTAIARRLDAR